MAAATSTNDPGVNDMRFIVLVMATKDSESAPPPKPEAFVAMQEYNEKAINAGVLLAAEGLTPSSQGVRVKFSGGKHTVVDRPFAETKELVAGFSIIKVKSRDEAVEWVTGAPYAASIDNMQVEIRRLMDVEDFGDGFVPNEEIAKVKF